MYTLHIIIDNIMTIYIMLYYLQYVYYVVFIKEVSSYLVPRKQTILIFFTLVLFLTFCVMNEKIVLIFFF